MALHGKFGNNMKMKHILVTGGAGFYGVNFIMQLAQEDRKLRFTIIDTLEAHGHLSEYNLRYLLDQLPGRVDFQKVDITDREKLNDVFDFTYYDTVVHFAAASSVLGADNNDRAKKVNIEGTKIVFDTAVSHGVKTFLHQSSGLIYGKHIGAADETFPLNLEENEYAKTKILGERYIQDKAIGLEGTRILITRPANTYGPFQWIDTRLIEGLSREAIKGQPFRLRSDGTEKREFIYAGDAVMGIINILRYGVHGEIYNVSIDEMTSVIDIVEEIASAAKELGILDKKPEIVLGSLNQAEDKSYLLDSTKLRSLGSGWKPEKLLIEGIRETLGWNYEHKDVWI